MKGDGCLVVFFIALAALAAYGWIANIWKLIHILNDPITGMFIFRAIGIFFAPLGVVLGFV